MQPIHSHISLNGAWDLIGIDEKPYYFRMATLAGQGVFKAQVPAPVHQVLMDLGYVEDPRVGLNSLRARWVEERFWIYRRTFEAPADAVDRPAWITFDMLEYKASVWLNGDKLGDHANANRPATFDATGKLRAGENLLIVQVEAGLYDGADKSAVEYFADDLATLTKRHWHRKPQYQSGWDWQQRLMNVGILGDVRLEWSETDVRLSQTAVLAVATDDLSKAAVTARVQLQGFADAPADAVLSLRIVETGQRAEVPVSVAKGGQEQTVSLTLDNPRLWWPIGHGEQYRYTAEVTVTSGDKTYTETRKIGVRRVELDQSPHPVEGRYFIVKINNRPIFCKGGNWVPADMLYSTVTPEHTRKLVDLAIEANFNMLRIWGGGLFAGHVLCEACDEAGILIWHDFLFACAKYPGDDPVFAEEVRTEVRWALNEFAHHPSLVIWCGNNEIEEADWEWVYHEKYKTHPHYALFHHDMPKLAYENDPSKAYVISSPFSPDYKKPSDPTCGDQHPWDVSLRNPGPPDWWEYRKNIDRFPNEGGVLGASTPATLREFLPEKERYLFSPSWEHHDNPYARRGSTWGGYGRTYEAIPFWLGRDIESMDWEQFALASGVLHADALAAYIDNYRRRMYSSAAAIFWMYNDSWPATCGWTIVDYYLRKKLSYHPVRRAFLPVTVVVADEDDEVKVFGVNDTPADWSCDLRYGLFQLAGGYALDESRSVTLPANASTVLAAFPKATWEAAGLTHTGAFAVLGQGGALIAQHRMFVKRFGELEFANPEIRIERKDGSITLSSDVFVWAICLDVDGDAPVSDNCFDLLPGVPYTMAWAEELGEPSIKYIGSRDAVGDTRETV